MEKAVLALVIEDFLEPGRPEFVRDHEVVGKRCSGFVEITLIEPVFQAIVSDAPFGRNNRVLLASTEYSDVNSLPGRLGHPPEHLSPNDSLRYELIHGIRGLPKEIDEDSCEPSTQRILSLLPAERGIFEETVNLLGHFGWPVAIRFGECFFYESSPRLPRRVFQVIRVDDVWDSMLVPEEESVDAFPELLSVATPRGKR